MAPQEIEELYRRYGAMVVRRGKAILRDPRLCQVEVTNGQQLMSQGFHLVKFCLRAPNDPCYTVVNGTPDTEYNVGINIVDAATPVNISLGSSWWNPLPPATIESCDAGDNCFVPVFTGATPPPCLY
jgi:hypothetical protein